MFMFLRAWATYTTDLFTNLAGQSKMKPVVVSGSVEAGYASYSKIALAVADQEAYRS